MDAIPACGTSRHTLAMIRNAGIELPAQPRLAG